MKLPPYANFVTSFCSEVKEEINLGCLCMSNMKGSCFDGYLYA